MLDAERVVRLLDGLGQVGRALVSDEEDAGEAGRGGGDYGADQLRPMSCSGASRTARAGDRMTRRAISRRPITMESYLPDLALAQ